MSEDTIVIKSPVPSKSESKIKVPVEEENSMLFNSCLWVFSSLLSATKVDFNVNMTGIVLGFNVKDISLIAMVAWMMYRGLCSRRMSLVFPWTLVTVYTLYYNQFKTLAKMTKMLRHFKHATVLPWIAIFASSVGLLIRVILVLRLLQLSSYLWYRRKLEKEMYAVN